MSGLEKNHLAKAQDKDFRVTTMNMFKNLNQDVNKDLKEVYDNTNSWIKTTQDVETEFNTEIESLKKTKKLK